MTPYSTIAGWRDKVSEDLGGIKSTLISIDKRLGKINNKIENHEKRVDCLEEIQVGKVAVKKYLVGLWAVIGGAVFWAFQKLAPIVFQVFK